MTVEVKKSIYEDGLEAVSYFIVFVIAFLFPTIISWIKDSSLLLLFSILFNSLGLVRVYGLLFRYRKVGRRFWFERLLGLMCSLSSAVYSTVAIYCLANGFTTNPILNLVFSLLLLVTGILSAIECILYTVKDYKDNVVGDGIVVAQDSATDV